MAAHSRPPSARTRPTARSRGRSSRPTRPATRRTPRARRWPPPRAADRVQLDLRGRLDRVAARIPPLRVALAVQDRYSALRGNQLAAAITLTAFLALFALVLIAVAVVGFVSAGSADVPSRVVDNLGLVDAMARPDRGAARTPAGRRAQRGAVALDVGGVAQPEGPAPSPAPGRVARRRRAPRAQGPRDARGAASRPP